MPQSQHMYAQLVRPPGLWHQPHAGFMLIRLEALPVGHGRFSGLMAHFLARTVRPIDDQRQIDLPRRRADMSGNAGHVNLLGLTLFELQPDMALSMGRQGKHHHPGGVSVQTVDQQCCRKHRLDPAEQTICQMRPPPRHRQQPVGLVDHQQFMVVMQDVERHVGWLVLSAHRTLASVEAPKAPP